MSNKKKQINIINFNVNGIRACIKKGFLDFIEQEQPDIFCLQETKINEEFLIDDLNEYPYRYFNFADKKGYSGVSIFSKIKPINVTYAIEGLKVSSSEGRVLTAEFESYFLITVYTPNTKRDLERLPYRYEEWDKAFLKYVCELQKIKKVVFGGDLNVAHMPIDLKNDKANKEKNGFTSEEREGLSNYLENGFIDSFRYLYPEKVKYSWWSYMGKARANNSGWRIDYFILSKSFKDDLIDSCILNDILGSDHCPIKLLLKV
jgi:exodeoxyribonuclease-3